MFLPYKETPFPLICFFGNLHMNWKKLETRKGLDHKFKEAKSFYWVIMISVAIGLCINFTPIKPFKMLYYSAALNGLLAPFLIGIIMIIANNKKIMKGKQNSWISNLLIG